MRKIIEETIKESIRTKEAVSKTQVENIEKNDADRKNSDEKKHKEEMDYFSFGDTAWHVR